MSNLNNLTSKILEDAKIKAEEIIEKAKNQEKTIIEAKEKEAEDIRKSMIEKAKNEADIKKDRILSRADLDVRNEKLKAKGEIIDIVFNKALKELESLSPNKYVEILKSYMLNLDIAGDEKIIVPDKYKDEVNVALKDINKQLIEKNKLGSVELYEGNRNVTSGFIIVKDGIEGNYTFDGLLNYYRDDLEGEIVRTIFN